MIQKTLVRAACLAAVLLALTGCQNTVNTSSSYGALVIRLIRASSLSLGCAIADRERIPSRNRNMLFVILFLII